MARRDLTHIIEVKRVHEENQAIRLNGHAKYQKHEG